MYNKHNSVICRDESQNLQCFVKKKKTQFSDFQNGYWKNKF